MPTPPTPTQEVPVFPTRAPHAHKGHTGRIAILAGAPGMSGAAVLAGMGALRGGAGLVRVASASPSQPIISASEASLMTRALPVDAEGEFGDVEQGLKEVLPWADVWAIGPGLGQGRRVAAVVARLVREVAGPLVLDADGLNVLAGADEAWGGTRSRATEWWAARNDRATVVTPHPGEMGRLRHAAGLPDLVGDDDETRIRIAWEYAVHARLTVILKGHRTVVATPTQTFINSTGNAGMATGGMGDVLTGLVAAFLGQGLKPWDATRLAVHVHGAAGDRCAREIGPIGFLARELAERIPAAIRDAMRESIGFK